MTNQIAHSDFNLSFPYFSQQLLQLLREWHTASPRAHPWQTLTLFVAGSSLRTSLNRLLLSGLEELARSDAQAAQLLHLRFGDELTAQEVANRFNVVEGTVYKWQRDAIDRLAETLWRMETEARQGRERALERRLPAATYTRLFGVENHIETLSARLVAPGPPWMLSIESLGGTGKTSVAQAVCRVLIAQNRVAALGWVTARQQNLSLGGVVQPVDQPALNSAALIQSLAHQLLPDSDLATLSVQQKLDRLTQRFQTIPHLVVIDNLESLADATDLLAYLRNWVNPTRFLLTTRHSLLAEADLHHFVLPPIGRADALALVRYEAHLRNLPAVAAATDGDLNPIYEIVGGNPLALRLVVGQLHIYPLPTVLRDLREAQSSVIASLYTHIYRQAWQVLSEAARRVLLIMPLVPPDGGDFQLLTTISNLSPEALRDGLSQLIRRNLVDVRGDLQERLYQYSQPYPHISAPAGASVDVMNISGLETLR